MAYKEPIKKLSINKKLCLELQERLLAEGRHGSLTVFVSDILGWYLHGVLVKNTDGLITAAKMEQSEMHHARRAS